MEPKDGGGVHPSAGGSPCFLHSHIIPQLHHVRSTLSSAVPHGAASKALDQQLSVAHVLATHSTCSDDPHLQNYFHCHFITMILLLSSVSVPKTIRNTCFLMVATPRLRTTALDLFASRQSQDFYLAKADLRSSPIFLPNHMHLGPYSISPPKALQTPS